MGVLDRLPEQAPQRIILDAERASFEQKARQIAGGSSSRYYESQNPVTFDWSGQLSTASSQAPDYGNLSLSVVMTPVKQVPLISDIIAECYKSTNGTDWTRLYYKPSDFISPYYSYGVNEAPALSENTREWFIYSSALLNSWIAWKFIAIADQPVNLSVMRIA